MKNYCPKEWALQIISEEEYEMLNKLAEDQKGGSSMAGSGTTATAVDIQALKTRLNTELERRSGHGALQG